MTSGPDDKELIARSSNFTVRLLSHEESYCDERTHHAAHDAVLLPLLAAADECWAYGIEAGSAVLAAGEGILQREGRRYRVLTSGDPVRGHEFFWNAHAGKRGSICIAVPIASFDADRVFPHCLETFVFSNYRSGHNTAAISYAQRKLQEQTHLVFCLPRNNGFEWMEIFAPQFVAWPLYERARQLCRAAQA